MIIPSTSAHIN